jgi:hypothetical protein
VFRVRPRQRRESRKTALWSSCPGVAARDGRKRPEECHRSVLAGATAVVQLQDEYQISLWSHEWNRVLKQSSVPRERSSSYPMHLKMSPCRRPGCRWFSGPSATSHRGLQPRRDPTGACAQGPKPLQGRTPDEPQERASPRGKISRRFGQSPTEKRRYKIKTAQQSLPTPFGQDRGYLHGFGCLLGRIHPAHPSLPVPTACPALNTARQESTCQVAHLPTAMLSGRPRTFPLN